jgi:hypothetical protein
VLRKWWSNINPKYRSWLVAILLIPVLFVFISSLDKINASSSKEVKVMGVTSLLSYCVIFFVWCIYETALIRNVELAFRELEKEDSDRLLNKLRLTTIILFCFSFLWLLINLILAVAYVFLQPFMVYGILSPFIILLILIYRYRKIKSIYIDYYANN